LAVIVEAGHFIIGFQLHILALPLLFAVSLALGGVEIDEEGRQTSPEKAPICHVFATQIGRRNIIEIGGRFLRRHLLDGVAHERVSVRGFIAHIAAPFPAAATIYTISLFPAIADTPLGPFSRIPASSSASPA
jgi:hypothetical protein